jgi:Polyketide cyclase / dehydrase and lipid transport
MKTRISAQRLIDAPAEVLYHCISDYVQHHRPEGFLPPAFSDLEILRGGVGAGTEVRWVINAGGRRRAVSATISEPVPGRRLVETGSEIETTFMVEPTSRGTWVRFDTTIDDGGLQGVLTRLFAARMFVPVYEEELRRLEVYARAHPSIAAEAA